jgi:hypothetical protein
VSKLNEEYVARLAEAPPLRDGEVATRGLSSTQLTRRAALKLTAAGAVGATALFSDEARCRD